MAKVSKSIIHIYFVTPGLGFHVSEIKTSELVDMDHVHYDGEMVGISTSCARARSMRVHDVINYS